MRILKNNEILERQSQNLIQSELSNVAMVLQSQQVLTTYYSINADLSERVFGLNNSYDYIGPDSTMMYNKIDNLPISGIDSLVYQNDYDVETGLDVDFTADGVIFANTVSPKPGDCFIVNNSKTPAIFIVHTIKNTLVRDLSCVSIEFRLLSNSPDKITQLNKQVAENYVFTVSNIGSDKNLVINKDVFFDIKKHVRNYLDIVELYESTFYDSARGLFLYKDLVDAKQQLTSVMDMTLMKFMFDESIIVYDDVVTFANNNYDYTVDRYFIDNPETVDSYIYKKSILYKIITKNKEENFDKYRYQFFFTENPQISRFTGVSNYVIEKYTDTPEDQFAFFENFNIFNDEFISALKTNAPIAGEGLKNIIISYYNGQFLDFENLVIDDSYSTKNFYLIPLMLYAYKKYIISLQNKSKNSLSTEEAYKPVNVTDDIWVNFEVIPTPPNA